MVTMMNRNGTGFAPKVFPRTTVILAPVKLPFKGTLANTVVNFNVSVVQALLDHESAGLHALNAEWEAAEDALDADESLTPDEKDEQRGPLWLASAQAVIRAAVDSLEWEYTDRPPPDPHAVEGWAEVIPPLVQIWIGQTGLQVAGEQFGTGPLAQQVRQSGSWSTLASLLRTLNDS